ncbi:MAG: ArsC family reductase [bacterium]|nr:ArsC family reductase [bacterium]
MLTIYGIKNCDTMKKAFAWLQAAGIPYEFHDYKRSGISAEMLQRWEKTVGWETLLNRRGTTWRKLPEAAQSGINRENALLLMQEQPSLIKRPVVENGTALLCGFDPERWQESLQA